MLIEFAVANFRSFKEQATLSLVAAKLKSRDMSLDENNTFVTDGGPMLLTSAAVYGANASGKSNLVRALAFMRHFVMLSVQGTERTGGIDVESFRLSTETADEPSFFEIVFAEAGRRYRYGFEASAERVEAEWLYTVPTTREAKLFERDGDEVTVGAKYFPEGRGLEERTRPNALFLSVVAQFDGEVAQRVVGWFRKLNVVSGLSDPAMRLFTIRHFLDGDLAVQIRAFVEKLDLGVHGLTMRRNTDGTPPALPAEMPEAMRTALTMLFENAHERVEIETTHRVYDASGQPVRTESFALDEHESEGTQKLVSIAGPLLDTLAKGEVLVVDELDARLHPLLTREIIKLFNDRRSNPKHAQLIFATHDTNLLDPTLLRRDQIWFVEKDRFGASDLYSLVAFKPRYDKVFARGYIQGRYGAIPYFGDLSTLLEESYAAPA